MTRRASRSASLAILSPSPLVNGAVVSRHVAMGRSLRLVSLLYRWGTAWSSRDRVSVILGPLPVDPLAVMSAASCIPPIMA